MRFIYESKFMKMFYLRWGGVLVLGIIIAFLGSHRYYKEVATIYPEEVLKKQPVQSVRVLGRVEAGSLSLGSSPRSATFQLSGENEHLTVHYTGDERDSLRELKTVVVVGKWDPSTHLFESQKIALTPNYSFVTAAYLIALIPLASFLFNMERKVTMLYSQIKQEKIYQPEEQL